MDIPKKRDERIDILRAIAILCIILAHSNPGEVIFQLRNFDVPMMVFLMGTSFFLSNQRKTINYSDYVIKRFKRLILPTWKFLALFFVLFYLLSVVLNDDFYFPVEKIITSFTIISGIGYIWIIRVFFIIALVSPLLLYISKKIKRNSTFFLLIIISYALYALLLVINKHIPISSIQKLFEYFIVHGFGYSIIAALGIRLYNLKKQHVLYVSVVFFAVFIILMVHNHFTPTQAFKYPPTMYYLSYGLFVSFFLFYFLSYKKIKQVFNKKPIIFLSKKSLDLYYCHIIPIYIIQLYGDNIPFINESFITRFLFLLIGALILLFLQISFFKIVKVVKENNVA